MVKTLKNIGKTVTVPVHYRMMKGKSQLDSLANTPELPSTKFDQLEKQEEK